MKALPVEEVFISPKNKKRSRKKTNDPRVGQHQAGLKLITLRLEKYAHHDLSDAEILALLNDTRSQVLGLHIARKQLERKHKKNNHKDNKRSSN
jgi:hypothetical protein